MNDSRHFGFVLAFLLISFFCHYLFAADNTSFRKSNCEFPEIIQKSNGQIKILNKLEIKIGNLFFDRKFDLECFEESAKIYLGRLTRGANIQNSYFGAGSFLLFYRRNGALKYAEISIPLTLQNHTFKAGSVVYFEPSSNPEPSQDSLIIDAVFSAAPLAIEGILCRAFEYRDQKALYPIDFFPSGHLSSCYLEEIKQLKNIRLAKNTWTHFYDRTAPLESKLKFGTLLDPQVIEGVPCAGGGTHLQSSFWSIAFHPNGLLSWAFLSEDHTLGGTRYPKGTIVRFDETGKFIGTKNSIWD